MTTPAGRVHWDSLSEFSADESSQAFVSTSSLQYINAQLVAHGFAPSPGLCLDGISTNDMERTVKCLLELLGQRVKDMARTEELSTELRTLSYDHQRLKSMHATEREKAANFEREMNVHKSRLAATTKTLQASEQANKATTAELQRTRGTLQAVRATHQAELKKKEKEVDKMAEKWAKLSDVQAKLSAVPSGFKAGNSRIVTGQEGFGKGASLLEVAAQEADRARAQITTECTGLKRVVLNAVNELQQVLNTLKGADIIAPTPFTLRTLFPFCAPEHASDHLAAVLLTMRDNIRDLTAPSSPSPSLSEEECARMQATIDALQAELDVAKAPPATDTETQVLFDKFACDPRLKLGNDKAEMSVELLTVPQHDELHDRLTLMRVQLEAERARFTEATIQLGHERATIENERMKLSDEKRSWQVEMMLSELPPTPVVNSSVPAPRSPRKVPVPVSPRKSPVKAVTRKTTRIKRKSSLIQSPKKSKVEPAYETEVIPRRMSTPPPPLPSTTLLPTTFVLPPPSPHSAFPSSPPLPAFAPVTPPDVDMALMSTTPASPPPHTEPETPQVFKRPYPMAKPFAPRMIHAYSPVRPSPLSRILQLANDSPPLFGLAAVHEASPFQEHGLDDLHPLQGQDHHPFESPPPPPFPEMSLAQELGIPDSPPEPARCESPLLDTRRNGHADEDVGSAPRFTLPKPKSLAATTTTRKGRVMPDPKQAHGRGAPAQAKEKENAKRIARLPSSSKPTAPAPAKAPTVSAPKPPKAPVPKLATSRVRAKLPGAGPKRVPAGEVKR